MAEGRPTRKKKPGTGKTPAGSKKLLNGTTFFL
jgi:hypothetical protein